VVLAEAEALHREVGGGDGGDFVGLALADGLRQSVGLGLQLVVRLPQGLSLGAKVNRDAPTFSPSIDCKGCWHGYIRNGRCVDTSGNDES
jgi:hypothetical protein